MGTNKRERKKANRAAKLEAERAAEARRRRLRFIRNAIILAVVIVVALFVLSGCSSDDGDQDIAGSQDTSLDESDDPDETPDGDYGTTPCPDGEQTEPTLDFDDAFERCIDPAKSYTATVETTEGTVVVALDTERTPLTANNFVALARSGYYDGTQFFRTEANTGIIQGGAPHTQSNRDPGPGYTIPDEGIPFGVDDYGPGTLAMARTSEPDSASAQFFFLASEGGRYLGDPSEPGAGTYQVFGKVTEGIDVLVAISALDNGNQVPSRPASIESVVITES